jgi:phospholipid/cholesterol/gamma-HCH transport system permease protein
MISVFCLCVYFVLVASFGGFFATSLIHNLSFSFFFSSLATACDAMDIGVFVLKTLFSGAIVFLVSCHQGLKATGGPHEVPQMTTTAVVNSVIYVVMFNLFVTVMFYLGRMLVMGVM